jgi:DNA recombination protein RmuC
MLFDNTTFYIIIAGVLLLGVLIGYLWNKLTSQNLINQYQNNIFSEKNEREKIIREWQQRLDNEKLDNEKKTAELKQLFENQKFALEKDYINRLSEKDKLIENLQAKLQNWDEKWQNSQDDFKQREAAMRKEFEILAQKILEEKSKKFTELNQNNMQQILTPFQEAMKAFKEKVEQNEKESYGRHQALKEQLTELQKMNQKLSQEALNLTKALKGESKTQGIWGETILNRLLEKSGLEKGREYFIQQSFQAVAGTNRQRVQPDVVIHLPDRKKLIIDAKVSLTAYERYINEEDENQQKTYLKQHLTSLKSHINGLAKKSYDELLEGETPEFILMFIPVEPAFTLALKEDPELYNYAFERNIVLVTPSTLLATLKIVDNMWRNEKQRQNAFEIAKQAGALYDKFHGLISDLELVGNRLSSAQQSFGNAMNKLHTGKGNLISKVEKLKELGAKAKKQLPETTGDND